MKKIILLLLIYSASFAQNPVPNPGFENWTGSEPDGWTTTNSVPNYPVVQTANSHSGNYALHGEVIDISMGGQLSPMVISNGGGQGFPVTQFYSVMTFWYETFLIGSDQVEATVLINDSLGNIIAAGQVLLSTSVGSYTLAEIPIQILGGVPHDCAIVFSLIDSISGQANTGSYFKVDDIELSDITAINNFKINPDGVFVFPNPFSDRLNIFSDKHFHLQNILIQDVTGREMVFQLSPQIKTDFLSSGIYYLKIFAEDGRVIYSGKFIKI